MSRSWRSWARRADGGLYDVVAGIEADLPEIINALESRPAAVSGHRSI